MQNLSTGNSEIADVPRPRLKAGHLLIQSSKSLISAGTERMLVDFGRSSYLEKARQQPEKVKQVIDKIKTDGLMPIILNQYEKMKRRRPKQHYRRIRTKRGIKIKLINKGIKGRKVKRSRYSIPDYKYSRGVIKIKRDENVALAREIGRHKAQLNSSLFNSEKIRHQNEINKLKRELTSNSVDIDKINKKFFPKNPS